MKYIKLFGLFVIIFATLALNTQDNFIARLGFESSYLLASGIALLIAWLTLYHKTVTIVFIVILMVGSNVTAATASGIGFERDILFAALLAIIFLPLVRDFFELE